jgi:bifunctional DNA-binding transcriptional regulator/antitoxin component of YhaV-PrlF toxin-antitoxin module
MLTGSELLSKVKSLGEVSKSELVRECGYVSLKKDGSERLNFTAFYAALLDAKGISVGVDGRGSGRPGRKLSFETKVQFNGNLLVGKAYTAQLGLQPGDEFQIKLGRKQITLIPIGSSDENPGDADFDAEANEEVNEDENFTEDEELDEEGDEELDDEEEVDEEDEDYEEEGDEEE